MKKYKTNREQIGSLRYGPHARLQGRMSYKDSLVNLNLVLISCRQMLK